MTQRKFYTNDYQMNSKDGVMEKLQPYLAIALERGADHAKVIESTKIVTAPWVRMKCQFGCSGYGRSLCCPPYTPTSEQMRLILDSYTHAILLHRHWRKDYRVVNEFNEMVVDLETLLFFGGYYKAWGLGCGPCMRCTECDTSGRCLHAHKARPSMEACGIDVFNTAKRHDLPIHVVRTRKEERDIFGLVLAD